MLYCDVSIEWIERYLIQLIHKVRGVEPICRAPLES